MVAPDKLQEFLDPLPVEKLWGVGAAAAERLHALGVHTVAELRARPETVLGEHFGKWGSRLFELAHGAMIDR